MCEPADQRFQIELFADGSMVIDVGRVRLIFTADDVREIVACLRLARALGSQP
jgi:hypothetical protein